MEYITLIFSIITAISAICAIVAFIINRQKDKYNDGADNSNVKSDIRYIRNSFDDLRLDVKEVARKQDAQSERLIRCEENLKNVEHRVDALELHSNVHTHSHDGV